MPTFSPKDIWHWLSSNLTTEELQDLYIHAISEEYQPNAHWVTFLRKAMSLQDQEDSIESLLRSGKDGLLLDYIHENFSAEQICELREIVEIAEDKKHRCMVHDIEYEDPNAHYCVICDAEGREDFHADLHNNL